MDYIIFGKAVLFYLLIGVMYTIGMWDRINSLSQVLADDPKIPGDFKKHKNGITLIHFFLWPMLVFATVRIFLTYRFHKN